MVAILVAVKAGLLISCAALLAACVSPRPVSQQNADTVYLRSGDRWLQRDQSRSRVADSPPPPAKVANRTVPAAAVSDPMRVRRTQLLRRIEDLSNDEADAVCLTMQLVPREQIFDRGMKPKKILLHYTSQVTSEADLDFLERVLNEPRR